LLITWEDDDLISRRTFTAGALSALAAPQASLAQSKSSATVFYGSVGPELTLYNPDLENAALAKQGSVQLPANIQYVWPHPSSRWLYVVSSNGGPGVLGDKHFATALTIEPRTGALGAHGPSVALRSRPIHVSVDKAGAYVLIAHNNPSGVTVLRINGDGTLGEEIGQGALDVGIFAHQIRVTPSNKAAILVARGNDATTTKPEDPGALKVFGFENGRLSNHASIAPGGGYGFGPRHLDYHPAKPWVYVSLERQNKLQVYTLEDGTLSPTPLFSKDTLAEPANVRPMQIAGTVHVHPNGRYVYVANRGDAMSLFQDQKVFLGGENNIAVFEIDSNSGEPALIQHAGTHGFHARTFACDPSGQVLIAANIEPRLVRDGDRVRLQPATLACYRIGADGKLSFVRTYDVETGGKLQFWSGFVTLT
jgi:6-phosphogluconolactonase (cycloisomerase 2 family)